MQLNSIRIVGLCKESKQRMAQQRWRRLSFSQPKQEHNWP